VESKPEEKLCEGGPIEIGDSDGKIKDDKSKPVIKERNPLPLKQKIDESKVGPSVKTKMEIDKEVKV
jgi:hypothetical protein